MTEVTKRSTRGQRDTKVGTNGVTTANGSTSNGTSTGHRVEANGYHGNSADGGHAEQTAPGYTLGAFVNTIILPVLIITLLPQLTLLIWYTNVNFNGSFAEMAGVLTKDTSFVTSLVRIWSDISIVNAFTVGVVFGYFAWALFWMVVLPGREVRGPVTPSGHTPVYKDNGFLHYVVTMAGFAGLTAYLKMNGLSPSVVYDRFGELIAFMNVFAICFCLFLYLKGVYTPSTKDSGKTGHGFIFDYYWGMDLYPRVFGIDVKVFTNCRVGMTWWPLLVCIYAVKSYELHGFVDSMAVATVLQMVYITKFFSWEAGYMCTLDIILDRAGFYICWGVLCLVPSLYTIVSQYLVSHPVILGPVWASIILTAGLLSILINYLADLQRVVVRKSNGKCLVWGKTPDIIRAKYRIQNGEERESILLASGWWGISRHFHYIPELMLAFLWTVPSGFENVLPYCYFIFLVILLTHRSFRDDQKCRDKYGSYWTLYCEKVKYKVIPYVF